MKRIISIILLTFVIFLCSCSINQTTYGEITIEKNTNQTTNEEQTIVNTTNDETKVPMESETEITKNTYVSVSMEEGKSIIDNETGYIILDVRTYDEYNSGHIPNAICLPYEDITEKTASELLPDKNQKILVYCRSGRRSKIGSETLANLGYSNIIVFVGIIGLNW